jgi:hypothetical protein
MMNTVFVGGGGGGMGVREKGWTHFASPNMFLFSTES